ncbi:MAG: bifunctional 2-polyprenyl-6-hydroxyphenol methylase/3-demethylubiquinol 3-O-methyltransferase UbiG [Alishewanella aestuarii]|uniref:Ubiquinone biosynthesis O-methyltransferase n=1 Tax=Alishewanella aestuarii B11 TaxID=1197174 RepID=J1YC57_9ALTE|nr:MULTISPECIES: bifunctional 2-polyprenyl-6-hydroxyphenol methylase/3-demethylubiquinol 3-O-methyltransferase UbiG [Alishewanella]EJI85425.1 3-demethylubiquinone-9 3-methyltransferase/ 2-octaprenyl-6-hydroxy phenol methylase [Alishewanella aestuarii B11]MCT8126039.1 bifunctional 2-polyprenyl-6-hydroxyphenol methylase/3-demethylubiquinol 3-O-methyltransferase UbiG [Alishewanella sp. BS5-314]
MNSPDNFDKNSNVDQNEISKFNEIAARWWDPEGEFKPLHLLNPTRLGYISDQLGGLFGRNTLDVGCGGGILAESMARAGAKVTGIDMAPDGLNVARLHALEAGVNIDYQQSTAEDFAERHAGEFELVTCMEMLEHVPDPASVVRACAELAAPGATLVFSTINKTAKAYLFAIVGAEYLLKLVPRGTHQFDKFIRPSVLMRYIEDAGLELVDATGLHFNPLNNSFKLGAGLDVNYFVVARKPL